LLFGRGKGVSLTPFHVTLGFDKMPICMAKTQYSFSHDAKLLGVPEPFDFPVREVRASVGAGFIFPISGA
jgi:formyltetrahydrofolate synthetase